MSEMEQRLVEVVCGGLGGEVQRVEVPQNSECKGCLRPVLSRRKEAVIEELLPMES